MLSRYTEPAPVPDDATIEDWMVAHMQVVAIDDATCAPNRMPGDTMDWDLAVGTLFLNQRPGFGHQRSSRCPQS